MKCKLVTYSTRNLNSTERSKISKLLYGYKDKSNNAKYTYHRKGLLFSQKAIKISPKTFIIKHTSYNRVALELRKRKVKLKTWDIEFK